MLLVRGRKTADPVPPVHRVQSVYAADPAALRGRARHWGGGGDDDLLVFIGLHLVSVMCYVTLAYMLARLL